MKTKVKVLKPAIEVFHFPKFTKASEVLTAAKSVIKDEQRWAVNDLAMTLESEKLSKAEIEAGTLPEVDYWVPCAAKVPKSGKSKAMAFCALGAVQFVNGPAEKKATKFLSMAAAIVREKAEIDKKTGKLMETRDEADDPDNLEEYKPNTDDIFFVNDENEDHAEVMSMFTLAIKLAKKAEA